MITRNNTHFRNLEEQVQFLTSQYNGIIEGDKLLAALGIKVVGQVATAADLPNPVTYEGEYGDAYLVGTETPYEYYIYTRPFEGETDPHWFNLGQFPVAGPQGEQGIPGPQGPAGERGSKWYSGNGAPTTFAGYEVGDYYFDRQTAEVYHYHNDGEGPTWQMEGSIRGPQGIQGLTGPQGETGETGPQGPQGNPGPAGPVVQIYDILTSVDQLPAPDALGIERDAAFIVETNGVKYLYALTGWDTDILDWTNVGMFSTGTIVKVDGNYVAEFDADTKISVAEGVRKVYITDKNGNNTTAYWNDGVSSNSFAVRLSNGRLAVGAPTADDNAVNLDYANTHYVPKLINTSEGANAIIGVRKNSDENFLITISATNPGGATFPQRDSSGRLYARDADPTRPQTLVNIGQADTRYAQMPTYDNAFDGILYINSNTGDNVLLTKSSTPSIGTIVQRTSRGTIQAKQATNDDDVVTLKQLCTILADNGMTI